MLKQLRTIRKENPSQHTYIHRLMKSGKIKSYDVDGYRAYDDAELEEYKKHIRYGRPLKEYRKVEE